MTMKTSQTSTSMCGIADPALVALLLTGDVLGASSVLRAEANDEVEEDQLAEDEPETDEDTDQQNQIVDVIRVCGKRLRRNRSIIDSSLEDEEKDSCDEQAHANHRDVERLTNQLFGVYSLPIAIFPIPNSQAS